MTRQKVRQLAAFVWLNFPFIGAARHIRAARQAARAKNWRIAVRQYSRALKVESNSARLWVQYGHALKESGDKVAAKAAYLEGLSRAPEVADTYVQLGHVAKLMGDTKEAIANYEKALALDPDRRDAAREREALLPRVRIMDASGLGCSVGHPVTTVSGLSVIFDVTDLLEYFQAARRPTGIQRCQIEIITALLETPPKASLMICCYSAEKAGWIEIPKRAFGRLSELAVADASLQHDDWGEAKAALFLMLRSRMPISFPVGGFLLTLGSPWDLQNYFLHVRSAVRRYGLTYVSLVHDLIPVTTPENCVPGLVRHFVGWMAAALLHTDKFFAVSEATKKDLLHVAAELGHLPPDIRVIPLDTDCRKDRDSSPALDAQILTELQIPSNPYVLFVSTIEPRKNHTLAFSAWLRLIRKRGMDRMPYLICVGGGGWMNEAIFSKLAASDTLQRRVIIMRGLSDRQLVALYRGCDFTIYPSLYEGWGLPVTESLCYGKMVLAAKTSSLPEAGGDFIDYFDPESEADFIGKLERLFDDKTYIELRERRIKAEFRPRGWDVLGHQIVSTLEAWHATDADNTSAPADTRAVFEVEYGKLYLVTEKQEAAIRPGMAVGEALRAGDNWWSPEEWGCWTKPGEAYIDLSLPVTSEPICGYLGLKGLATAKCRCSIEILGVEAFCGAVAPGCSRWVAFKLPRQGQGRPLRIIVKGETSEDLSKLSNGHDRRVVSVGVIGIMLCGESDLAARINMLEAIQFDDMTLAVPRSNISAGRLSIFSANV